jgi:hypothetical protein
VIDDATGEAEDVEIPWERAEAWVAKAVAQVNEVSAPFMIKGSQRGTVLPTEAIEGRLVRRNGKVDVE